jgi:hypothetical protein
MSYTEIKAAAVKMNIKTAGLTLEALKLAIISKAEAQDTTSQRKPRIAKAKKGRAVRAGKQPLKASAKTGKKSTSSKWIEIQKRLRASDQSTEAITKIAKDLDTDIAYVYKAKRQLI